MNDRQWESMFGEKPDHHLVSVYSEEGFERILDNLKIGEDAIIEIYSGPNGKPVLPQKVIDSNMETIIALDFEDYPEDVRFPSEYQPTNPTITYEDAERLVWFIEKNIQAKRNFIIHCGAGVSRSQQVAAYILMIRPYTYEYDDNSNHFHHFSQTIVLSRLLEVRHKVIPGFENRDNAFEYDDTQRKWVLNKEKK